MTDKIDIESVGYDKFLRRGWNPIIEVTEDDAQVKTPQIPTSTVKGDVPKEQIEKAVNDISRLSQVTTIQFLDLASGLTVTLFSQISDLIYPDKIILGITEITPYEGAVVGTGTRIGPNASWQLDRGFDYTRNFTSGRNGKALNSYMAMYNVSGSTKSVYWYIRWRFIGTNTIT